MCFFPREKITEVTFSLSEVIERKVYTTGTSLMRFRLLTILFVTRETANRVFWRNIGEILVTYIGIYIHI